MLGSDPKITESASGVRYRTPSPRSQFPSGDENRCATPQAAQGLAHQENSHLRPKTAFARLSRGIRPLLVCPETLTRSWSTAGNSGREASANPPENLPSGGRPRDSRSWAESAYLRGRTQTMAILTLSRAVSSFGSPIRRLMQKFFTTPRLGLGPGQRGRQVPRPPSYTLFYRSLQVGRIGSIPANRKNRRISHGPLIFTRLRASRVPIRRWQLRPTPPYALSATGLRTCERHTGSGLLRWLLAGLAVRPQLSKLFAGK